MRKSGTVYLIGAGPGDPELITIKGKEILKKADVIVYDYLVNPELLRHSKDGSEVIYVGKKAGQKALSQSDINKLLIKKVKKVKVVARLKGGDPFIFGRGGEEVESLVKNGIDISIVPGVTSASAVPSYAGIPLTHRDITSSFAVVTGHENPTKDESNIPWRSLSNIGTLVFLMGVKNLKENMNKLIDSGKPARTPAAVITWGTYPFQTTVTGTIGDIAEVIKRRKDIASPAVTIVGDVVGIREIANWYESRPLFGKRVVVTRAEEQATPFVKLLSDKGANVIEFPTIEIKPPKSFKKLDEAIYRIKEYDWIIFTSLNGVNNFFKRFIELKKDIRELYNISIAAIGQKTANSIEEMSIKVEMIPDEYVTESLIDSFRSIGIEEKKILIPRAKVARNLLPTTLEKLGAIVDVVTCYETGKPQKEAPQKLSKMLKNSQIDVITFTSPSTATNFLSLVDYIPAKTLIACIGPITASAVKKLGHKASIVPSKYTIENLAEEISNHLGKPRARKG